MGLAIDTPWNHEPWTRVDSAGQPIELSRVGEEIEDRRERAEAREMAERLRRQVGKWDGRTDLAEPQQRTVVELAGAGAAVGGAGAGSKSVAKAGAPAAGSGGGKVMLRGEATANKNAAQAQSDFNSKHPRNPAGSSAGGKFAKGSGSGSSKVSAKKGVQAIGKGARSSKARGKGKALKSLSHAERHRLLVRLDAKLKAQGVSPKERLKVVKAAAHRLELAAMKPRDRVAAREMDRAQATVVRDKQEASKAVARQQAAAQHAAARQAAKALAKQMGAH